MADFMQDGDRTGMRTSVKGSLDQLDSVATTVIAVKGQLQANRATIVAGIVDGTFTQADVDKIDALTPKVAAFLSAAQTYLG